MSFVTSIICDHPHCDAREDHPHGHVMEPELVARWATIYAGLSLTPKHLCPGCYQRTLTLAPSET